MPRKAVSYARVSSKEQEKEGFSIPAQQKLLHAYADQNQLFIEKEFVDVETAKQSGRVNFSEMVRYLKSHPQVQYLLVEKTDRLYRNLKDWVILDELDLEIQLVKEGVTLSRDSRSSEKFVHGIKVLMAKNYVDNLSEEARKGMQEKAEQGIWPTVAPLGYLNVVGPDGKKIIVPDPKSGPIVAHMFGWYASGTLSLKQLAERARSAGLVHRKTGAPIPVSKVHSILRNRIYTGDFEWKGQYCRGKHQPLITHELFDRVQGVMDGRNARKIRGGPRDFAFSGLITCGHCGCAMIGEIKKGKYIYYHCTGFKQKCPEPYVREEVLEQRFSAALGRLAFRDDHLQWLTRGLRESLQDEAREHEAAIARLKDAYDRLQVRIHAAYVDKLDGKIEKGMFEALSAQWRAEQSRCIEEISLHQAADQSYLELGARLLDVASNSQRLFERQEPSEKRRVLNFVLSNSKWKNGQLSVAFRQPFDLIAKTAALAARRGASGDDLSTDCKEWLPGPDSNQRPTG
ncbi:recombinase family protein [Rhodovulum sp. PH10]|uniref:recombinase family protein n=1 Tax=Rhodovulum sp. PH10 TaxID=1187851 RepID=UPI000A037EAF